MTEERPAPMVPAEVDLRGLEYMPLLGARLFESDFYLDADDAEFRVGVRLWWAAWNQVPAGSLPREDKRLRKLAGLDEAAAKWKKVSKAALHGFVECSDGRLYHPVIAEQALIAWEKRAEVQAERENTTERKRRDRAERAAMFAQLRAVGVIPAWDIKKDDLRKLHEQHVTGPAKGGPVTPPVTVTGPDQVTPPVTVTDTAKTGRDGTGQVIPSITVGADSTTVGAGGRLPTDPPGDPRTQDPPPLRDDDLPPPSPTDAGRACLACRGANVHDVNTDHPDLLRLLAAGVTPEEIGATAAEIVRAGKPARFAYVLRTVESRRQQAAARGPVAPKQAGRRPALNAEEQF